MYAGPHNSGSYDGALYCGANAEITSHFLAHVGILDRYPSLEEDQGSSHLAKKTSLYISHILGLLSEYI